MYCARQNLSATNIDGFNSLLFDSLAPAYRAGALFVLIALKIHVTILVTPTRPVQ